MISDLPNDIIEYIAKKLHPSINNIRSLLIISGNTNDSNLKPLKKVSYLRPLKKVSYLRIRLFLKLTIRYTLLKKNIVKKLRYIIKNPYPSTSPSSCVYYAPHIKNGNCRFCMSNKSSHLYSEKLICDYYFKFI